MGKHQRRLTDLRDDVGHRKGLPRTCDAKQCLVPISRTDGFHQFLDCLRLITCGRVFGIELEG